MKNLFRIPAFLALGILLWSLPVAAQYSFDWEMPPETAVVSDFFILHDFMTEITNTSAVPQTFRVQLAKGMPASWQATICEGPICYPPHYVDHTFELAPGESTNLDFAITPVVEAGTGVSTVTVTSLDDPSLVSIRSFTVISAGLDVLFIDADNNLNASAYFTDALDGAGRTWGAWDIHEMGVLALPDLQYFGTVIWSAGTDPLAMDAADMAMLDSFVFSGGNLFVSSQNLARIYCDPGSPFYSADTHAFFLDVLNIDYVADNAGTPNVEGAPADPYFSGLSYLTVGGDGAGNNSSPDELALAPGGVTAMVYETGAFAGIRGSYGQGNTFYTGFSFEAVSTSAGRTQLMDVIVNDWLIPRPQSAGDLPLAGNLAATAVPNPFNPRTEIRFTVGGTASVDAELVIHDIRGRAVRRVDLGPVAPGERSFSWNGRDGSGRALPSGLYLAIVRAGDQADTVKMTLTK